MGRTAIYLAFNVLFVITLAFGSSSAAGGTTVLSYSYLFASYLVAGTGMALGMSSIPDMTREARTQQRSVVAATVPRGFRYAMLIAAPALAVLIAAGATLVHGVLPRSLSASEAHTLQLFGALLVPWTVAALLVNFLMPVLLALGRARLLGALALPLVMMQLAVTALGSALFGVDGAVGAFWIAPSCLAAALLVAAAGREGAATARLRAGARRAALPRDRRARVRRRLGARRRAAGERAGAGRRRRSGGLPRLRGGSVDPRPPPAGGAGGGPRHSTRTGVNISAAFTGVRRRPRRRVPQPAASTGTAVPPTPGGAARKEPDRVSTPATRPGAVARPPAPATARCSRCWHRASRRSPRSRGASGGCRRSTPVRS